MTPPGYRGTPVIGSGSTRPAHSSAGISPRTNQVSTIQLAEIHTNQIFPLRSRIRRCFPSGFFCPDVFRRVRAEVQFGSFKERDSADQHGVRRPEDLRDQRGVRPWLPRPLARPGHHPGFVSLRSSDIDRGDGPLCQPLPSGSGRSATIEGRQGGHRKTYWTLD